MTNLYLETSIQLDRLLGSVEVQNEIISRISGHTLITSTYVLMEFRRTILKDLTFIVAVLNEYDVRDNSISCLNDVSEKYKIPSAPFTEISKDRALSAINMVLEEFYDYAYMSVGEMKDNLRWWIEELEKEFHYIRDSDGSEHVLILLDPTNCDLAAGPFGMNPRKMMCIASLATCDLPSFLVSNTAMFTTLEREIRERRLTQMQRYLNERERHKDNTDRAKGQESCWILAEAIKSVEVAEDSQLYSSDDLMRQIAAILGRRLLS